MDKAKHVIALDCIRTGTTEAADVLIPAPTCIETNGTFVNNEGRAQRFYQVFVPPFELSPIWRLMREFGAAPIWSTYDGVLADMACDYPDLASLREAAPPADWRSPSDQKVARMPHRYSGRTAKHADRTVFEPMPPADPNTPLAFTMEGEQGIVPGPLVPRFWYPGWNSEAATNKFQIEVGGPLHGGVPGKRLIEPSGRRTEPFEIAPIEPAGRGEVWVVPKPHIFGSEELSRIAPWLIELTPPARITVHPNLAKRMGMAEGKEAEIELGGQVRTLPAHIDESIAEDVVSIPANFQETIGVTEPVRTKPEKGV
jgi:NADH-quinone oxidoreductase subunit G